MANSAGMSRRAVLAGGVVLLGACSSDTAPPARTPASAPGPGRGVSAPVRPSATTRTVADFLSRDFVVAHRGSGDNWPEHTLTAYEHASLSAADAIEISVRATSDGILVCHHDADTKRTTGVEGRVSDLTFRELSTRRVDARPWLGQEIGLEPIPTLAEVLRSLPPDCLVFIEDKDGTNTHPLLDMLDSQPRSTERFVWKQWAPAQQTRAARARGYLSWGYLTSDVLDRMEEAAQQHDMLGVPVDAADGEISRLVETGRPVMAWEVHTRSQRDRLRSLGVAGLMCSNVPYVLESEAPRATDSFGTGLRAPGDLPADPAGGWSTQPRLDAGNPWLTLQGDAVPRYLLGSMSPTPEEFRVSFTVAWAALPQGAHPRAGLAFCLRDDDSYHPRQPNNSGSYQAFLNADGRVALAYQAAGWTASENLATIAPSPGGISHIEVEVTRQRISFTAHGHTMVVNHMDARGGYMWLWGEQLGVGARFSDVAVAAL